MSVPEIQETGSWHIMDEAARYQSMTQAELQFAVRLAHAQLFLSFESGSPSEAWARASFLASYESLQRSSLWRLNRDLGRTERDYGTSPRDAALKDLMLISALEAVREHEAHS